MMAMAQRDNPIPYASEGDKAPESSAIAARSALQHWQWAVRGVPFISTSDEARTALCGLAAWYERICVDDKYDNPAPPDGLDALAAYEHGTDLLLLRRDLVSHWAFCVAQALAGFRRQRLVGDSDPVAASLVRAKLDLALQGAFDRVR
jgi:hypothetical protein